jgi:hypothetical protein
MSGDTTTTSLVHIATSGNADQCLVKDLGFGTRKQWWTRPPQVILSAAL